MTDSKSAKTPKTRYESDWKMVNDFVSELQREHYMIVASKNIPNHLLDSIDWSLLDGLQEKLEKLVGKENHEDLNRVDSKSKKLNSRYKKIAMKEAEANFDREIIRIAGLLEQDSDTESKVKNQSASTLLETSEELSIPDQDLT